RDVEPRAQRGNRGNHPIELVVDGDFRTGAGFHATDIEDVGALGHQMLGPPEHEVHGEMLALVEEGIGCAIEDPHDERACGEVVGSSPDRQLHAGEGSCSTPACKPLGPGVTSTRKRAVVTTPGAVTTRPTATRLRRTSTARVV